MTIRKRRSDQSRRAPLLSPGQPPVAGRKKPRRFWPAIVVNIARKDAAIGTGVAQALGKRWFRKAGGMPPAMFGRSAKPLAAQSKLGMNHGKTPLQTFIDRLPIAKEKLPQAT
jgi:hypothetical protein